MATVLRVIVFIGERGSALLPSFVRHLDGLASNYTLLIQIYTADDIAAKFEGMPRLTPEEADLIQNSWQHVIRKKMDKVGQSRDLLR